jgi:hypothetical protein
MHRQGAVSGYVWPPFLQVGTTSGTVFFDTVITLIAIGAVNSQESAWMIASPRSPGGQVSRGR